MKHFYDLRTVEDLEDGETATPEPGVRYELRSIRNEMIDAGPVRDVIRRGDALYARTDAGESFPVTGADSHVLVPIGL
ncbi:MAG: hypothetical protein WBD31_31270 [Rubripirellula sp.]